MNEAKYLLAFSNQPSPMFLIGYLCLGLFSDQDGHDLILPLLFGIYGSAILISIIYRSAQSMHRLLSERWEQDYYPSTVIGNCPQITCCSPTDGKSADSSPLSLLESSMMTSFEVMVKIGGYMMLFSIAEAYLSKFSFLNVSMQSALMGLIEMTTGSRHIAAGIELPWSLALCGSVAAFGGLSGFAQTAHILQGSGLSPWSYFGWKLLQGGLAGILISLCCYLTGIIPTI